MKTSTILVVLSIFAAVYASNVIVLDSGNFHDIVGQHDAILVEFYAPWCGHCKSLAPEYEKAADELKESNIPIAKIDASGNENSAIAQEFDIKGFPTIKLFKKGVVAADYEGDRTAQAIVKFMKKANQPTVTALKSEEDVANFVAADSVAVIGYFHTADGSEYSTFAETAESLSRRYSFGSVIGNAELAKQAGLNSLPGVVLFKNFDEKKNILTDFADLENFIKANSVPLIGEISQETFKSYTEANIPLGYIFANDAQKAGPLDAIRPVAEATRGKINWAWIDAGRYGRHAENLGLSGKVFPSVAIDDFAAGNHYAFDEKATIDTESISSWANKVLSKEIDPTIKSEDIPEDNNGPVKVVVAKNYNQIVMDDSKDVLLEFYAPWCGHCKKLAPAYEELGKAFRDNTNVVIAKIDATANDIAQRSLVRGFPTIILFPAGQKASPVVYQGDRSVGDLTRFILNNGKATPSKEAVKDEL